MQDLQTRLGHGPLGVLEGPLDALDDQGEVGLISKQRGEAVVVDRAQQVEEVLPDAVEHRETGMMAVRYERLVPLLIEAIKELKSEIDELKGK